MIPTKGQHVKCLLKNNVVVEGIVEEWFGNYVKLNSIDGKSYSIIHHPDQDIVLTKVVFEEIAENSAESEPPPAPQTVVVTGPIHLKKTKPKESEQDEMSLEAMTRAERHVELAKQEREIVAAKLRDHHIGGVKRIKYGQPGFYKKPSTK